MQDRHLLLSLHVGCVLPHCRRLSLFRSIFRMFYCVLALKKNAIIFITTFINTCLPLLRECLSSASAEICFYNKSYTCATFSFPFNRKSSSESSLVLWPLRPVSLVKYFFKQCNMLILACLLYTSRCV